MGGFYREPGDPVLRFGDVLSGYVLGAARQPHARSGSNRSAQGAEFECLLDMRVPRYCVLLTPCCAIGMSHHYSKDRMLTVAPLVKVHGYWFSNPNWSENLLKVNTPMRRDLQMPPKDFLNRRGSRNGHLPTPRGPGRHLGRDREVAVKMPVAPFGATSAGGQGSPEIPGHPTAHSAPAPKSPRPPTPSS